MAERSVTPDASPGVGPTVDRVAAARRAPTLISPSRAGEVNRSRVLQSLYDVGPLSRADLARLTGVTRATIGSIVQPMIDQGLLSEGEPLPTGATGGKPARPLWFSPTGRPIAAAHLLPGHVEAALVSPSGTVLTTSHGRYPANTRDTGSVLDCLIDCLTEVLPADAAAVVGIGIAVGGMVDTDTGAIVRINMAPGLTGMQLGSLVATRLALPVHIDLHPRAQALGDRWFGQGRGLRSFASIYTGEAIGVGLVLDGTIHRGPAGSGGEIGHTTVDLNGEVCRCGQQGCWETIATHRWLRAEAARLDLPGARSITTGPLTRLAARGHPHAADLFDRYAANLAIGIANLEQICAPGLFILHGDAVAGGEALRSGIERHVRSRVPEHPGGQPHIAFTTLDDHATLRGAAGLVLSHSLQLIA